MPVYRRQSLPPAKEKELENLRVKAYAQEVKNEDTDAYIDFLMAMQGIDIHEDEEEEDYVETVVEEEAAEEEGEPDEQGV